MPAITPASRATNEHRARRPEMTVAIPVMSLSAQSSASASRTIDAVMSLENGKRSGPAGASPRSARTAMRRLRGLTLPDPQSFQASWREAAVHQLQSCARLLYGLLQPYQDPR